MLTIINWWCSYWQHLWIISGSKMLVNSSRRWLCVRKTENVNDKSKSSPHLVQWAYILVIIPTDDQNKACWAIHTGQTLPSSNSGCRSHIRTAPTFHLKVSPENTQQWDVRCDWCFYQHPSPLSGPSSVPLGPLVNYTWALLLIRGCIRTWVSQHQTLPPLHFLRNTVMRRTEVCVCVCDIQQKEGNIH